MRISIDGGGICAPKTLHFGTKIFTSNIISAFGTYDKANTYLIYSFCNKPSDLNLESNLQYQKLRPKIGWMKFRVSAQELLQKPDIYFGLSQAIPLVTKSRVFTFIHGLSFFHYKDLYKDSFDQLKHQLFFALMRSETIFVSSQMIKDELEAKFKHKKVIVLPLGVPFDIRSKRVWKPKSYFLFVGMNHPIKQIKFIIDAFTILKEHPAYKDFQLYLVGNHTPYMNDKLGVKVFPSITRRDLGDLYVHASAYVTSSLYESFNFPVLEALANKCPVIARDSAVIPEMKSYVNAASDMEEFVDLMKMAAQDKLPRAQNNDVISRFSWEKTVDIITQQYKQ